MRRVREAGGHDDSLPNGRDKAVENGVQRMLAERERRRDGRRRSAPALHLRRGLEEQKGVMV